MPACYFTHPHRRILNRPRGEMSCLLLFNADNAQSSTCKVPGSQHAHKEGPGLPFSTAFQAVACINGAGQGLSHLRSWESAPEVYNLSLATSR